jgi:hypothetical protein
VSNAAEDEKIQPLPTRVRLRENTREVLAGILGGDKREQPSLLSPNRRLTSASLYSPAHLVAGILADRRPVETQ